MYFLRTFRLAFLIIRFDWGKIHYREFRRCFELWNPSRSQLVAAYFIRDFYPVLFSALLLAGACLLGIGTLIGVDFVRAAGAACLVVPVSAIACFGGWTLWNDWPGVRAASRKR